MERAFLSLLIINPHNEWSTAWSCKPDWGDEGLRRDKHTDNMQKGWDQVGHTCSDGMLRTFILWSQGPQEGSLQEVSVGTQPQAISIQVEEAEVAAFCTLSTFQQEPEDGLATLMGLRHWSLSITHSFKTRGLAMMLWAHLTPGQEPWEG